MHYSLYCDKFTDFNQTPLKVHQVSKSNIVQGLQPSSQGHVEETLLHKVEPSLHHHTQIVTLKVRTVYTLYHN